MPFQFRRLAIPDVILVQAGRFGDERGFFMETYKLSEFSAHGIPQPFVQDNRSYSVQGVLRGLHYQKPPRAQGKLVTVLAGEIFDVAVDIRPDSPTYRQWVAEVLAAENGCMLYIPAGFAHGFCILSREADVLYKATEEYAPELDSGIAWNDPDIGIAWPIATPLLSAKDARLPRLREANTGFGPA
jgi:dTDP-4-dehydrorhamnose 3,5-epimerase